MKATHRQWPMYQMPSWNWSPCYKLLHMVWCVPFIINSVWEKNYQGYQLPVQLIWEHSTQYPFNNEASIPLGVDQAQFRAGTLLLSETTCFLCLLCSVVSWPLQPHRLHPARLLCPQGFSRQETGLVVMPLLQDQTQVFHSTGRFYISEPPGSPTLRASLSP